MSGPDDSLEDILVGYVSTVLELRERGEQPSLEDVCRDHPELVGSVAAALADATRLPGMAASAHEHDALIGRALNGRYRLEARLGAGAMGLVYRGRDLRLGRAVAVKILRPELFGGRDAELRFAREAEVLAKLRHPNVVAVHDSGRTDDGVAFLVMELLTGLSLPVLLNEHERRTSGIGAAELDDMRFVGKALPESARLEQTWLRQAVRWTAELAAGLGEAHRLGILHRDVKSSNVFIAHDGSARVIDFGVASTSGQATLTAVGGAPGTPAYMAPEVIVDQAPASAASDVYGLGATLYHLLTRRPPYLGTATHVIASVQRRDPLPVGRLRAGLPRDLHAIVDRAMGRKPELRYASMAEFEADLRAFLEHRPVHARPVQPATRMWRALSRSPLARAIGVLLSVAALIAMSAWLVSLYYDRRALAHDAAAAQFPPALGIELAEMREIRDPAELSALRSTLDRAVETSAEPLPSRMLRAAFALDQGDALAASVDMTVIADVLRTELSGALAARYRDAATRGGRGHSALVLHELPAPSDVRDGYLLAYHLLRGGRGAEVDAQIIRLFDSADTSFLPGQEMLANALHAAADRAVERGRPIDARELATRALQIITSVEIARGCRTALTANQLGANLLMQRRYAEAVAVLDEGCQLCPWSNGLLRNLAKAQARAEMLDAAIVTCDRAISLRPSFIANYKLSAELHVQKRDYVSARAVLDLAPFAPGPEGVVARQGLAGATECCIALRQFADGDTEGALASARSAEVALSAAGKTNSSDFEISRHLANGDFRSMCSAVLVRWAHDPESWESTTNLALLFSRAESMGIRVDTRDLVFLSQGLQKLAQSQSPSKLSPPTVAGATNR